MKAGAEYLQASRKKEQFAGTISFWGQFSLLPFLKSEFFQNRSKAMTLTWEKPGSCLMLALHQGLLHPSAFDEHFCTSLPLSSIGQNKMLKPACICEQNTCFLVRAAARPCLCLRSQSTARCPNIDVATARHAQALFAHCKLHLPQGRPTQGFSSLVLTKSLNIALSLYHLIKSPIIEFCR